MDRCSKELFLASCGLSGPLRLNLEEASDANSRVFEVPFVVAGRDPKADLIVDHPTVSPRQIYLQVIAGRIFYVDIASRSGVDGESERVGKGWVDDQRGIRLGPVRICAEAKMWPCDLGDPLTSRSLDDSPLPAVVLEFPQQVDRPSWRLSRVLTLLGRTTECRLRFLDSEISKFHCSLLRTPTGVWAIDLLGRTGIRLNGQPIRWAQLEDGDQLQVGRHLIRVRCAMPSTHPSGQATRPVATVNPRPERPAPLLKIGNGRHQNPPALASNELAQSVLATMASQFGQMQQQMFDQFQQALVMMAQTFGALQRDQMAQVRDELDQLRRLNQDLLTLQTQANRKNLNLPLAALPSASTANGEIAKDDVLAHIESLLQAPLTTSDTAPPQRQPSSPSESEREHEPIENGIHTRTDPSSSKPPSPPPQTSAGVPKATHSTPLPDEQIHGLLCRRMAQLQQERQGRWQRICDLVLGR